MRIRLVAMLCVALLSACGGGGGDDAAVPPPVAPSDEIPATASASAPGLVAFLLALAADLPDDREPLDVSRFVPPLSETDEPIALQ